jgi:hypothetical protein
MICKHGHSGGRNLFEVLYQRDCIHLDYNLQRILVECIIYDSEVEADEQDRKRFTSKQTQDRYTIAPKSGMGIREMKFEMMVATKYPEYRDIEITLLTKEEFSKVVKSAHYHRNTPSKS